MCLDFSRHGAGLTVKCRKADFVAVLPESFIGHPFLPLVGKTGESTPDPASRSIDEIADICAQRQLMTKCLALK
jgi:hypothetical protein